MTDPAPTISFDDEAEGGDELLLDAGSMMGQEADPAPAANGTRSWLGEEPAAAPQPAPAARSGGTLFERMSNIARGAAKAQVEEEQPTVRNGRDQVELPRFLNRQNNQ